VTWSRATHEYSSTNLATCRRYWPLAAICLINVCVTCRKFQRHSHVLETRNMSPVSSVDEALGFGGGCFGGSCLRVVGQGLSSIHPGVLSPRICLCRSHLLRKKTPIIWSNPHTYYSNRWNPVHCTRVGHIVSAITKADNLVIHQNNRSNALTWYNLSTTTRIKNAIHSFLTVQKRRLSFYFLPSSNTVTDNY